MWSSELKRRKIELLMSVILILIAILFSSLGVSLVDSRKVGKNKKIIVIDSGHGGVDSGKVSVLGEYEKDINLAVSRKLKDMLVAGGYEVIMTRTDDEGLYTANSSNKKSEDLKKRCEIIDNSNAVFAVSIHQNSYHESSVKGAQVFYYKNSDEGKVLAETIQDSLREQLDNTNKRQAKNNSDYYLLRNTKVPTVIVECGFLSNYEEAKKLSDDMYQKKVAQAIFIGIEQYLENDNENREIDGNTTSK